MFNSCLRSRFLWARNSLNSLTACVLAFLALYRFQGSLLSSELVHDSTVCPLCQQVFCHFSELFSVPERSSPLISLHIYNRRTFIPILPRIIPVWVSTKAKEGTTILTAAVPSPVTHSCTPPRSKAAVHLLFPIRQHKIWSSSCSVWVMQRGFLHFITLTTRAGISGFFFSPVFHPG